MPIGLNFISHAVLSGHGRPRRWVCAALVALAIVVPARVAAPQSATLTKNYQRGSTLFEAGMYEAATPYFLRALTLSEQEYGPDSSRTGFILKNLATVYAKRQKYALAEPVFLRALTIFEETFGPNNGLVAEVVSDLSFAYVEQKKFIQAEPLLARVMNDLEVEFGPDDPRVAVAAYNYGSASEFLGDASKAREFYTHALRIWQSQSVPNDTRISAVTGRIDGLTRVGPQKGPSLAPYFPKLVPGQAEPANVPVAVGAPSSELPAVAAIAPAAAPPEPGQKAWHVQLASFRDSETADRERKRLQQSFGPLFADTGRLQIVRARLAKGEFFRLGIGPMADRAAAGALCRALKARGQACFVARR